MVTVEKVALAPVYVNPGVPLFLIIIKPKLKKMFI